MDEIDALLLELKKDITYSADNKLNKEIKDVYREEVDNMYEEYTRTYYNPRYDNKGFADESNWDSEVKLNSNGITYELINETLANGDEYGERLDSIIEDGIYGWNRHPEARPVYERTMERLGSERVIENILESELSKKGWEVK